MIRPSIRQLSYLIAVNNNGSFIKAAETCGVTQSTLSAGIKELENILQHQLINRGKKGAVLTPFGLEVVEQAQDILHDTDAIVARAKMMKEPMSGPLRLGVIPTIAPYMLPDILPKLAKKFPKLELQLFENITENLLDSLQKNQLDVILMAFPYETPYLTQHILFEEPFMAAMPDTISSQAKPIKISDLSADTLLLLEDGHCLRDHALSACDLQPALSRKTFSATSLPTLIQMVRAGYGMTLLPEMACKDALLPPDITLTPFMDKNPPTRQIGLCWRDNDPRRGDYETLANSIL